jgi:pimeloyl-ACP methyl ester carboxylesterase
MLAVDCPDLILFTQHGMTDDNQMLARLAHNLADSFTPAKALVVAPSLGYLNTIFLQIDSLIETVDQTATATSAQHPKTPIHIVATSLGGIVWIEVLHRHPEWWARVQTFILLGSPVGGAHLAKIADPFGWGIGIAKDLGMNRRVLAEKIAKVIPTLIIAGDIDNGSDGTVTIESTKFRHAYFVRLDGVSHPALRNHPAVTSAIQSFWAKPRQPLPDTQEGCFTDLLIQSLRKVPGMTDAHPCDFAKAGLWFTFKDGTSLRTWKNPVGVDHVFIANPQGQCIYGGYVGWIHCQGLADTLATMRRELA